MTQYCAMAPSILEQPFVRFDRAATGDLGTNLGREWLVTNGLGSYASGTVAGPPTRSYHGLLVAALEPPVERTVLVAGSIETLVDGDVTTPLTALDLADGGQDPPAYRGPTAFWLEGTLPVWQFAVGDVLIERRLWMPAGEQATWLTYRLVEANRPIEITFAPLIVDRSFHTLETAREPEIVAAGLGGMPGPPAEVAWINDDRPRRPARVKVRMRPDGPVVTITAADGRLRRDPAWTAELEYREERARGLAHHASAYKPATFRLRLEPGDLVAIRMGLGPLDAEGSPAVFPAASLAAERRRQAGLLDRAHATDKDPAFQQLVLAADQFIVDRHPAGRTVIAGYHWFNDWGRDTMIALPGLTLATGRPEDGAAILRSFAPFIRDGLLPNSFPDRPDIEPDYNTADASLWYPIAIARHAAATNDTRIVDELLPAVREIVERHLAGTRFGIGVDPADGLLRAGVPGSQLTWMDARADGHSFTPRVGKPVEIQALWFNALSILAAWLAERGDPAAATYEAHAERARQSFTARFVRDGHDELFDVVDGPDGDETHVRPNQVFAIALLHPLLDGPDAEGVLRSTERLLRTPLGLRSLAPVDPDYHGTYLGDRFERDAAYHQGTVWTWLIGPFVEAHLRLHGDVGAARALLAPFAEHLREAGLGSVSEILDGDPPHAPRGCIAQAWGVAEVLRAWRLIDAAAPERRS